MRPVSRRAMVGSALSFVGGLGCARPEPPHEPSSDDAPHAEGSAAPQAAGTGGEPARADSSPQASTASQATSNEPATEAGGDDADQAVTPDQATCESTVTVVGRNHGHVLVVPDADVLAATERSYSIRGSSDHDHQLLVTSEEFRALGLGEVLRKKTEFGGGHRHRVLVRCQPSILPPEMISACDAVIAGEDGHEVIIPESHVRGGVDREYDIQGVAGHTHTLKIRAADFARLLAGEKLDIPTEYGAGHFHHAYVKYFGPQ